MRTQPHERFSRTVVLTEKEISSFATASGDSNPLHHDQIVARRSGYGGIIASGPQTSALLMGTAAAHFSRNGPMVGLEFTFHFRAPVPANESLKLEWLVVRVTPTRSGTADVAELRGRLRTSSGLTAVGARGSVLLTQN